MGAPRSSRWWAGAVLVLTLSGTGCGDGGTGIEEEETGATLQGQIVLMGLPGAAAARPRVGALDAGPLQLLSAPTSDVSVSIGGKSTRSDAGGFFVLHDIPLGDQAVVFSGSGITGSYSLNEIVENVIFILNDIQVADGLVKTAHTGTWVGTAGSSQPGSQGQIAFTLIIAANGNALSGTGRVEAQDTSQWSE